MTLVTSDLGLVQAIFPGTTPPSETAMLWYNTQPGEFRHYYFNIPTSAWVLLNQSSSGGAVKEKVAARVASTGNESAVTYNNTSKTITVNAPEGVIVIDKVTLSLDDRVVWGGNGVTDILNGLYTVTTIGTDSVSWVLTRATDSDSNSEINSGEIVPVLAGELNQGISFILTTDVPISLGTSSLKYTAFSVFYNRSNPTTVTVGGLLAGSTPSGPIQNTLDKILYPFLSPSFGSFGITGQPSTLELGQKVHGGGGTTPFTWNTVNSGNVQANSLSIIDVTSGNIVLGSSLANDGSESLIISSISKSTLNQTHQFKIQGFDINSVSFNTTLLLTWLARRCYFVSSTDYYTPSGNDNAISSVLNALTANTQYELSAVRQMSKSFSPSGQYIYFVWLDSLGGDNTIFTVNSFPNNSWVYKTFSYINSYGLTTNFRIFRSLNILSTNFNVVVN